MSSPEFLRGPGLLKWETITAILDARRLASPVVLDAVAAYCVAYGRWAAAETWLNDPKHGPVITIKDDKGNIKSHGPSPYITISERAGKEMSRIAETVKLYGLIIPSEED